jgi:hypothetical protein
MHLNRCFTNGRSEPHHAAPAEKNDSVAAIAAHFPAKKVMRLRLRSTSHVTIRKISLLIMSQSKLKSKLINILT